MEKSPLAGLLDYVVPVLLVVVVLLVLHLLKTIAFPHIFPWVVARITINYNKAMASFKQELLKDMKDQLDSLREKPVDGSSANGEAQPSLTVLEIGVGSGANFKFYPDGTTVIAVEPNKNFVGYLEKSVAEHFPRVRLQRTVIAYGEDLRDHVEDCSVDAVVCTLVLCSVRDIDAVLQETKRVLKPGGKFYFLDHIAADPETWTSTLQWVLRPVWSYVGDGCQLVRKVWPEVDRAGFSRVSYKKFLAHPTLPRVIRPHVMGMATK
ncbi:methyltransferase-like protein 7A [Patiria miniata]|uniref:Methyltransferase type 11 domain-containing protein n=1 Tax=Patiria miniata TaxID=46514 RepID=A0A913ZUY6_PATMI|nr:methyltransferase-like protein 7A [Patiria miniata]